MKKPIPEPGKSPATVQTIPYSNRTYERKFVDCNKSNCSSCQGPNGRFPSHGPYWYLCIPYRGKWWRVYLGKNLDTTRFITSSGAIDWPTLKKKRRKKSLPVTSTTDVPGQVDMVDQANSAGAVSTPRGPRHIEALEDRLETARDHAQEAPSPSPKALPGPQEPEILPRPVPPSPTR